MKDTFKTVLYALLIALTVRVAAFEPFSIPSGVDGADAVGRRLSVRV